MIATATFQTSYAGPQTARVVAFKTTRRGERVERYRWICDEGEHVGYLPFSSVERAVAAVARDQRFSNVVVSA